MEEPMRGDVYTLTDEEGKEQEFELLATCRYEEREYYALVPVGEQTDEYVILRVEEENGEPLFVTVDDDDEFDAVADIFEDEVFADIDYDEDDAKE